MCLITFNESNGLEFVDSSTERNNIFLEYLVLQYYCR